jgi:hypothetical protein
MKRWTKLFDASDVIDTMEFILLLEEGKDGEFVSTTKGGKGMVWRVKEGGEEYITVSSGIIGSAKGRNNMKFYKYRHTILKEDALDELERIIVENRL